MPSTSSTQFEAAQPAPGRSSAAWLAVVGFDGSGPSRAALEVATELIRGRNGHLHVVYVAHLPASVAMSAPAVVGVREGFDVIATELIDKVRAALDDRERRWNFARRDGSVADELLAAARELRQQNGPDSIIVIVVGSAERLLHHVSGSTAAALTHEREFPLLVVPPNADVPRPASHKDDATGEYQPAGRMPDDDILVERGNAERLLLRAGFSEDDIAEVLGPITFPAPMSVVVFRGQQFGISAGSLMERLGVSP